MKVWVVEWRSAVLNYGGGDWTDIKGVFSSKEAAHVYAEELVPKATDLTSALLEPTTRVYEFTLDEKDEAE